MRRWARANIRRRSRRSLIRSTQARCQNAGVCERLRHAANGLLRVRGLATHGPDVVDAKGAQAAFGRKGLARHLVEDPAAGILWVIESPRPAC
eukprot:4622458-Alexandrium_andersonii.AAC.1